MMTQAAKTRVMTGIAPDKIPYAELLASQQPAILKGVALDWPLVQAGQKSAQAAIDYIKSFYQGHPAIALIGPPDIAGRFFYNADVSGFNFASERGPLDGFLDRIQATLTDANPDSIYVGSANLATHLPGLREHNDLALNDPMFAASPPLTSIWIGNRTTASCHYDLSNNMAICVTGHRRFTLFPPDQGRNLYPGPLEPTPGGQVVSMVDFNTPDYARHPRFAEALAHAQVAELEPGDMLIYPAMWWHHVEALDPFNILINYWWNLVPVYFDSPQNTLLHALLSLRDRPENEKAAWRDLFDYYVFGPSETAGAHLPEAARGPLGPMDEANARRLRATLLNRLNR
ncbi:MAG: cupin-like domain-containing protein [Asticcacaulis sp.]